MKQDQVSFNDFLSELTASLEGSSGEIALRRINSERVIKLVLEEVVRKRHDVQIRIINDSRIAGESGADILLQIDDYDIRLEILDAPENKTTLDIDQLVKFQSIFEDNPSTEILIVTWTTGDLNSIQLNLQDLDSLIRQPHLIPSYVKKVQPLQQIVTHLLESLINVWDKMPISPQEKEKSTTDIKKIFSKYFRICLEEERNRSFKINERKAAAASLIEKDAVNLLNNVLDQALRGDDAEELSVRLFHSPKRSQK
jgi:hypothetical protein